LATGITYSFSAKKIVTANYRPFTCKWLYRDDHLNEMPYQTPLLFGDGNIRNPAITVMGDSSGKPYFCLAIDTVPDFNFVSPASGGTQTLALFRINAGGKKVDNVTDWALEQFTWQYGTKTDQRVTKRAIFHYVYAVLHDPAYRKTYSLNLKRELPRIPFYENFWRWSEWGERLMALHIDYGTVELWPLKRIDVPDERSRKAGLSPKVRLQADKSDGSSIWIDSETKLTGVPLEAWTYRLGNRSALEWIFDQFKEKKSKDPSVAERFDSYSFAGHKERVVELLGRLVRVSVETMAIVKEMDTIER